MKRKLAFTGVSLIILALADLCVPATASAQAVNYTAIIRVEGDGGTSLGYVQTDPNYWTPLLTPDSAGAMIVSFRLPNGQTGTQIDLATDPRSGFAYFGPVTGRDSTSSDIAPGSFNYLYLGHTNQTVPNSPPQSVGNFFQSSTGLDKQSESAVWTINIPALTLVPQWINRDQTTPGTFLFVQSNHLYAGGDPDAFHNRFPAPVTRVTLHLQILTAVPEVSVSLTATPSVLWPANQKMTLVTLRPTTTGFSGTPTCAITTVGSSDPASPEGDWQVTGNLTVLLRAERLTKGGLKDGRVYTITVQCTAGTSSASKTTTVLVPHDQGK